MKPDAKEVRLLDKMCAHIRRLAERNGVSVGKLRLDRYEFEVSDEEVKDGICLYYCEVPASIQASKHIWYTMGLSPISLETPNWKERLPGYLKLLMGGPDWYKEEHHLRTIGQAKPSGFFGARMAKKGEPYAVFFKLPKNARVFSCSPQPIECYAEEHRLNLLFLLATESPEPQPRSLDISYDIV